MSRAWLLPSPRPVGPCSSPALQVSYVIPRGKGDRPDSGFRAPTYRCKPSLQSGAREAAQELENQIKERQGLFFDMEAYLPKKNG